MNSEIEREREERKISGDYHYRITRNSRKLRTHTPYTLIPFSSLLLSRLCFIVPTFKYSLHLSDDIRSHLFFVLQTIYLHTMLWTFFISLLLVIQTSSLIDNIGKNKVIMRLKYMLIRKKDHSFFLLICKSDNIRHKILSES
jgi:hypothetical protein